MDNIMEITKNMKDMTGRRFGRLQVLKYDGNDNRQCANWLCKCDCGVEKAIRGASLRSGATTSCGCFNAEKSTTHGLTQHRTYNIWQKMKARCYDSNHMHYNRYGGRGIKICKEWESDFHTFYKWAMASGYKDVLTIDRINNDEGYSPSNCKWSTIKQQMRNKTKTLYVELKGERFTIPEISEIYNINKHTLYSRYRYGKREEELVDTVKTKGAKKC